MASRAGLRPAKSSGRSSDRIRLPFQSITSVVPVWTRRLPPRSFGFSSTTLQRTLNRSSLTGAGSPSLGVSPASFARPAVWAASCRLEPAFDDDPVEDLELGPDGIPSSLRFASANE